MQRPVNNQSFDVSVEMTFSNLEAYQNYRISERHHRWITLAGSMTVDRVVFDSFLLERSKKRGKANAL
jgi:hypothetical protein